MIVSRNWLQKYFEQELPPAQEIADALTFGVAEIERVEENGHDALIDVKVLPDRACYLLSHRGIAKEISTLMGIPMKDDPFKDTDITLSPHAKEIHVAVVDEALSPYYSIALVRNVKVGPSPQWLKEALERLGQRSINNIVDATNYIMLDLGTPLHAFDAHKTSGNILVRTAQEGETIQLLGGAEKKLTGTETLITDKETSAPLALAGVKGGMLAELTEKTVDVILEAATFDPTRTRKTATKHDVRTDASKRFENHVAPELPPIAMKKLVALVIEVAGGELSGFAHTEFKQRKEYVCGVSTQRVRDTLGVAVHDKEIVAALSRVGSVRVEEAPGAFAVARAKECVGKPYKKRARVSYDAPEAFDCSSLTAWAYAQAGVGLPRISVDQYVYGDPVDEAELKPGDLVFFNTERESAKVWDTTLDFLPGTQVPEGVSHVVMYTGSGMCVHARSTAGSVVEEPLEEVAKRAKMVGCRRIAKDEPRVVVTVPTERLDLRIAEDLIEEVGRIHGYDKVLAAELPENRSQKEVLPIRYWSEVIRGALTQEGFLEVLTYSLRNEGEVKLMNALASDKSYLRANLDEGVHEALDRAEYYAALVGVEEVAIFEIGTVFSHDTESIQVCIAARAKPGKKRDERTKALLEEAKKIVVASCGIETVVWEESAETCRFNLSALIQDLPAPQRAYPDLPHIVPVSYQPLSVYPFVLRDIALWVSEETTAKDVEALISKHAGSDLVRVTLFDEFKKENKVSFAFHLVFQSNERTLSDEEVTANMMRVVDAMVEKGFEVR